MENLAQGPVFVVKGTNLYTAGVFQAVAPKYPTILNNVRITFTTIGGVVYEMLMVYTFNDGKVNQLAGVVPSNTPLGVYECGYQRVRRPAAAFRTILRARKPGIVSADGSGAGIAQATLEGKLILQRNSARERSASSTHGRHILAIGWTCGAAGSAPMSQRIRAALPAIKR